MKYSTKFIHTSDLQIGMRLWFLGDDGQPVFDADRLDAIRRIGEIAVEEHADFIVIAGDVFDDNALNPRVLGRAVEALKALPVPVLLLPGNHDPLTADSIFRKLSDTSDSNLVIITDNEPIGVKPHVEVVGAPWRSKHPVGDLVHEALADLEPTENIRVCLAHGQFESWGAENRVGLIDEDMVTHALDEGIIDYVALGDTHSTTQLDTKGRIWFSGAPETTDFKEDSGGGEVDSGNVLVVSVEKQDARATVTVTPRQVGKWQFEALSAHLYSREDVENFLTRLDGFADKSRTVIKYALTGTLNMTDYRFLQEELAAREPLFVSLRERKRLMNLHIEPNEDELAELDMGGVATAAVEELMGESPSQTADSTSRDAVNLLFRLAKELAK